jgi:SAM-dependent methyltransferase
VDETAYRQFVELEQSHFWLVSRRAIFFDLIERAVGPRRDLRILDVGCGAGGMLAPLSRYGDVAGIELSEEMVAICRARGFARVSVGSAENLPGGDGMLDLVTLFDTIEHVPDDIRVLRECRRVLAPGALVFISVPAYQFLYANNDRVANHYRRYTARELRRKMRVAGLEPVHLTYFNTLLFPIILPVVLLKKVRERFVDPGDTTNLSATIPRPLNRLLTTVMSSERHIVPRWGLPFGHSLIAIARRSGSGARVGDPGLEPGTSSLSEKRSNRLS